MLLYFQWDKFLVNIQKLDTKDNPRSVIYWRPLIKKYSTIFSYKDFIDSFVHPIISMLTNSYQPRISQEIKRVLQLEKNSKVGD